MTALMHDNPLGENGILIVTGSNLRAEQGDRPLAYKLRDMITRDLRELGGESEVLVLSDMWYLHSELLHEMPMISIGGPTVNAVSAYLSQRLPTVLIAHNTLIIQMDPRLEDFRASVWGVHHETTVAAIDLFVRRGYLDQLLRASISYLTGQDLAS